MRRSIAAVKVAWPGPALVERYVELRASCARTGHALAAQGHEADRWIAATAIFLDAQLITHDRVFTDVPGVDVLTRL